MEEGVAQAERSVSDRFVQFYCALDAEGGKELLADNFISRDQTVELDRAGYLARVTRFSKEYIVTNMAVVPLRLLSFLFFSFFFFHC